MWWNRCSTNGRGIFSSGLWIAIVIGIAVALMAGRGFGGSWWIWIVLFFAIIPAVSRRSRGYRRGYDDFDKPKHDFEKPKRKRYVEDSNGDTLEVIEDEPPTPRPDDDDPEYV